MTSIPFHPFVEGIAADLEVRDSIPSLPPQALEKWSRRARVLPQSERETAGVHLILFASELRKAAGPQARGAVEDLGRVLGALTFDFVAQGEGPDVVAQRLRKAAASLGLESSLPPTQASLDAPTLSLMDLLAGRTRSD